MKQQQVWLLAGCWLAAVSRALMIEEQQWLRQQEQQQQFGGRMRIRLCVGGACSRPPPNTQQHLYVSVYVYWRPTEMELEVYSRVKGYI